MKLLRYLAPAALLLACSAAAVHADVSLPKVFGSHMVLQQGQKVPVWGKAAPGEEVTVTLGEQKQAAKADEQGKWRVTFNELKPGAPLTLTAAGKNTVKLDDVLVGEVWVCSGQSNMEMNLGGDEKGAEEIKNANYPEIRLFTVKKSVAEKPQDDCDGAWAPCSPQNAGGFTAVGYSFGRDLHKELKVPVGLIHTSWGGTICEAWTSQPSLAAEADFAPILERAKKFQGGNPNQAAVLYNGMIQPLVPFAIRGAIWYQGESNRGRAEQYQKLFPAMITDWRKNWAQGDFPFLFVQLAPYKYEKNNENAVAMAELQEAQQKTLSLPNTGMAVTSDISNLNDIHPRKKQQVGSRLALWALANTYGKKDLVFSGPLFDSAAVESGKIRVKFKHTGGGLVSRDGKPLTHFEICGSDGKYVPAKAEIDGQTVVVSADGVAAPEFVRFAWRDIAEPNLMNKEGLPASLFRTDSFKLTTAGQK